MSNEITKEVQKDIDAAKALGHVVYSVKIAGARYIYRSINRGEFRDLQSQLTSEAEAVRAASDLKKKSLSKDSPELSEIEAELETAALGIRDRGEDRLVKKGLVCPDNLPNNAPAGVVATLADRIMEGSGFQAGEDPEIL
jgi:hypothetical protein